MDFNNPEFWLDTAIHDAPQGVNMEAYQAKINNICGLNPFGGSNIKLSWCPSMENYSKYYSTWDKSGLGIKTQLRGQYVYFTVHDKQGNPIDIPPPRWALKQFIHPSRYIASEGQVRWKTLDVGQQVLLRENRPPRSDKGYYAPFLIIGEHNDYCCIQARRDSEKCWGKYREPDDSYLTLLQKAVKDRAKDDAQDPNAPLSADTLRKAALETAQEIADKERKGEFAVEEYVTANLDKMVARLTGDKDFLTPKTGYSFSNGGILLPK